MPAEDTLHLLRTGKLHGIRRLDLSAGLTEFPPEIYDLSPSLEILNLSDNLFTDLPDDLPRLENLRIVFFSGNRFTHLPEVLGRCPKLEMIGFRSNAISTISPAALPPLLRWLVLTDNRLTSLPPEIGNCKRLQKLMLSGNLLTSLPGEMAALTGLELLRLASNRFETLPPLLLDLPRLAWLAFSGNPATQATPSTHTPAPIGWDRLHLHEKLGEGASGNIFRATWHPEDSPSSREVAVKLFKGTVTSDGLPEHEIAACLAAGEHPHLIGAIGKIIDHPEDTAGLVMPLVDPGFHNLAGPPSLHSCTRDVYPEDRHFPFAVATRIARNIASAAIRLHHRGILHGDLYAHNILWQPDGGCLLGDFGAASPLIHPGLGKIEVRAYGHLLGELIERIVPEPQNLPATEELLALKDHCLCPDPRHRPDFRQILAFFDAA